LSFSHFTKRNTPCFYFVHLLNLKEYVLVYQSQIKVEVYRQDDQGNWSTEVLGKDDKLRLDSVDLTLTGRYL
jgi:Uma2 family endonuclease